MNKNLTRFSHLMYLKNPKINQFNKGDFIFRITGLVSLILVPTRPDTSPVRTPGRGTNGSPVSGIYTFKHIETH